MPKPNQKNLGAQEFSRLPESTAEIAAYLEVSQNYVSQLKSGNRAPGQPLALKIAERWTHIQPMLWISQPTERDTSTAEQMLDAVEVPDPLQDTPVQMARRIIQYAQIAEHQVRDALRAGDPGADKSLVTLADIPIKLGKLTGHSLTEREVLDSVPFRDLARRLIKAIESLPNPGEVAKAMREALGVSDDYP